MVAKKSSTKEKGKVKAHVSEEKIERVRGMSELMKKKTVMIISVKGLPSRQFQEIKKEMRKDARIRMARKSIITRALEKSGINELKELENYVTDGTAILFSDSDAFEIAGILADKKSPQKAKTGQVAPFDIEVKAGPTDLLPGPDISALSAVGLVPKVDKGKIAILHDKVLVKAGDKITEAQSTIMGKLGIVPFKVGIDPVAAYMGKKVYTGIKIDKVAVIAELENMYGRALPFAVEIGYVNNETRDYLLIKAAAHEKAIASLINTEVKSTEATSN